MASDEQSNNRASDVIVELSNGIGVRRYRQSDISSISRHASNKYVTANLRNRMPYPYTHSDAKEWIDRMSNPEHHVPSGTWTMDTGSQGPKIPNGYTITVNDEAVGSIGLRFNDPMDVNARGAEVGYWIGEEHWGKGIMSAVVPAFVAWAWKTFGILVRIEAEVYDRNAYSRRILEKAGFQYEGTKKWAYLKNGVIGDVVILGLTRPDMEG